MERKGNGFFKWREKGKQLTPFLYGREKGTGFLNGEKRENNEQLLYMEEKRERLF